MKVITPGHLYELANFEKKDDQGQCLQFIEKHPTPPLNGVEAPVSSLTTIIDGTTNEEVLAVLIDRMNFLQAKFPCTENGIVQTHLASALNWLQRRTANRQARGVEGQHLK